MDANCNIRKKRAKLTPFVSSKVLLLDYPGLPHPEKVGKNLKVRKNLKKSGNELKNLKNTGSVLKNLKKSGNLKNICR